MQEVELEVIYENMAGLKVYYSMDDRIYAVIYGDKDLDSRNAAICFDDLLEILRNNTELPGRTLAARFLSNKRNYYIKHEMQMATTEEFQERFEVLFITSAERFGGVLDFYFVYDKKNQGYLVSTYDELMNKFNNNEDFDTVFTDMDAFVEEIKERKGIVEHLATLETKHRQFEMALTYLEVLKENK